MDILKKATKLVKENKIKEEGKGWFKVKSTKEHLVFFKGSKVSCDCRFFALHGTTKGFLCSHILAVIIYKWEKEKT